MTTTPPPEEPAPPAPPPASPRPSPPQPGHPFLPVARIPWINPDRRGHLAATAIVAALVLLLAGFGIGYAVAPDNHRDHYGPMYMRPAVLVPGNNVYPLPRHVPNPRRGVETVTVTPAPTTTR
jgi:hypothetical protein